MSVGRVLFVLVAMFFAHTYADFCSQGIMASMKQKKWWKKQEDYTEWNSKDYTMALVNHSLQWSFCIMLPLFVQDKWEISWTMFLVFFANVFFHYLIDNYKANKYIFNLVQDQFLHLIQILWTFAMWMIDKVIV